MILNSYYPSGYTLEPIDPVTLNEIECNRENGERVWVAWTSTAVPNEQRNLSEFLEVGIDITEHSAGRKCTPPG